MTRVKGPNKCYNCGGRNFAKLPMIGPIPWKSYLAVLPVRPPLLWTCLDCSERVIRFGDAAEIDAACERAVAEMNQE